MNTQTPQATPPRTSWALRLLRRLRCERGDSAVALLVIVPTLLLLVGLVIDGAGKIQAQEQATAIAQSAARAAANAGATPGSGGSDVASINPGAARQAAQQFLAASGASGEAQTTGAQVQVTARVSYQPKFLPIGPLTGQGQGSAELRRSAP